MNLSVRKRETRLAAVAVAIAAGRLCLPLSPSPLFGFTTAAATAATPARLLALPCSLARSVRLYQMGLLPSLCQPRADGRTNEPVERPSASHHYYRARGCVSLDWLATKARIPHPLARGETLSPDS